MKKTENGKPKWTAFTADEKAILEQAARLPKRTPLDTIEGFAAMEARHGRPSISQKLNTMRNRDGITPSTSAPVVRFCPCCGTDLMMFTQATRIVAAAKGGTR